MTKTANQARTPRYSADGTIHVHAGGAEDMRVTFIPDKYVEHGGSKFAAFVPVAKQSPVAEGLFVRVDSGDGANGTKGVQLDAKGFCRKCRKELLQRAAVRGIKVTVTVSLKKGSKRPTLKLKGVVVPAVPA